MLNEARDPVTQWKAQNDHFFLNEIGHGYFPIGYPTAFELTKLA
jgi:hypothetical protein